MDRHPYDDLMDLIASIPRWSNCDLNERRSSFAAEWPAVEDTSFFPDVYARLSRVQAQGEVKLDELHIALLASTYEGESSPEEVAGLVSAHSAGKALLNKLCVRDGLGLRVLDMAVQIPDRPGRIERISSPGALMANVAFGMEATASGGDLIGLSALAPGGRQWAIAILCHLHGEDPEGGINEFLNVGEAGQIAEAMKLLPEDISPLDCLACLGGREMAALAGAILAASSQSVPVMLEGWAALAAATVLVETAADGNRQDILGHVLVASSGCPLETSFWEAIGQKPILQNSGEMPAGSGLALAAGLLKQTFHK